MEVHLKAASVGVGRISVEEGAAALEQEFRYPEPPLEDKADLVRAVGAVPVAIPVHHKVQEVLTEETVALAEARVEVAIPQSLPYLDLAAEEVHRVDRLMAAAEGEQDWAVRFLSVKEELFSFNMTLVLQRRCRSLAIQSQAALREMALKAEILQAELMARIFF
jgi:hypothetical protein